MVGDDQIEVTDLDAVGVLAATTDVVRRRRLAEVDELSLLAQWAVVNGDDPTAHPDPEVARVARLVGDRLTFPGGEGTPGVRAFSISEMAIARQTGDVSTRFAIADALDLQHRLPLLWIRCQEGTCEPWVARKVARMSRHLPADRVGTVDTAVARIIDREAPGRVLSVAEAAVITADPALHDERQEAKRRSRFVSLTRRTDDPDPGHTEGLDGVAILRARIDARDGLWLDALLNRVADLIAPDHPEAHRDELRAIALGMLAHPADLLTLLLSHTDDPPLVEEPDLPLVEEPDLPLVEEPDRGTREGVTRPPAPESEPDPTDLTDTPCGLFTNTASLLDALARANPAALARLRPKTVLYVHLHEAALTGQVDGCARVEGIGPVSLTALKGLLDKTDLVVKPVVDLNGHHRSDAYEHPEALKEHVFLLAGGEYWPFGASTRRDLVEFDHVTRYDHGPPGGRPPPGQTGRHNSGPLTRSHHRLKTFAGYQARQFGPAHYAVRTPHGLTYVVDATGTRPLDPEKYRVIYDAPPGLDLYPTG